MLFIEVNEAKCGRIRSAFEKAGSKVAVGCAVSPEAAFTIIRHEAVDAVFVNPADHHLDTIEFMRTLTRTARQVPVVMALAAWFGLRLWRLMGQALRDSVAMQAEELILPKITKAGATAEKTQVFLLPYQKSRG